MYYNRWAPPPDELYHFGVKGMRWGVRKDRRYVTKGGSGHRHYNKVDKHLGDRQLIRKGTKMYRMTTAENESGFGSTYVTFQDADRMLYRKYITDTKDKSIARREGVAPLILFDRGVLTEKSSTLYDSNNRDQWNAMYKDYNKSRNDISQMRARKAI